ncbi:MAG: helix-turn-helix domain-containing protein [Planctomycetota bacterium]|jgi:putative zinc finger/helix-turn-helix YgiT family protein
MNRNSKKESSGSGKEENLVCPECGSVCIETSEEEHSFPYGIGEDAVNLTPIVPIRKCADCGFCFLDRIGEVICHEAVCKHLGVMTPSQVRDLRKMYNLTQAEFSEITKLGHATLSRWERAILIQNQAYDNYLYLLGFEKNLQRVRERGESPEPMEPVVKRFERPQFRELDVNDEVLQKKDSFKLNQW